MSTAHLCQHPASFYCMDSSLTLPTQIFSLSFWFHLKRLEINNGNKSDNIEKNWKTS